MKWVSHEIVTGMAVYAATGALLPTACAMAGAVLPDWLEGKGGGVRLPWAGLFAHRGWSHWPLLYVLALLAVEASGMEDGWLQTALSGLPDLGAGGWGLPTAVSGDGAASFGLPDIVRFLLVGALFHIAEDAVCGKVPLLHPRKKVGLRLFRVGSFGEYAFALAAVAALYAAGRWAAGG